MNNGKFIQIGIIAFMKFTASQLALAIIISTVTLAGTTRGQEIFERKVSVKGTDESVKKILKKIEKQLSINFTYNPVIISNHDRVNIDFDSVSLHDAIDQLFGYSVRYQSLNDKVIIIPLPGYTASKEDGSSTDTQSVTISGTVVDDQNNGLPGVNVLEKGTTNGTTTDANGNFTLSVDGPNAVIVFSFIGYQTQEVQVNNQTTFNVTLTSDVQTLGEVVVVGYGTQKKETLTGSVSSVSGKELANIPVTNVSQGLAGRLPGVVATSNTGEPGYDGVTLRIRGINTFGDASPLIVVDGVPGRSLERIDPSAIETISVLKDASAAIYGAQAANGVILITTKRGSIGKPSVKFTYNYGNTRPTRLPKMANAAEYATLLNEIDTYAGATPRYTAEEIQKFGDGSDLWRYPNSNYFKETLKPWSAQTYGNVSLNGGSEKFSYFITSSTKHQDAFYRNSATYYNQYDLRANLDVKTSQYITFMMNAYGRMEDRHFPQRGSGEIFNKVMRSKPILPAYWPNGLPGPGMEGGDNPVVLVTDKTGYQKDQRYVLNSDFQLTVKAPWVDGLSASLSASLDKSFTFQKNWSTPWTVYSWDGSAVDGNGDPLLAGSEQGLDDPRLNQYSADNQSILTRAVVNYERKLADVHTIKLMAGVEKIIGKGDNFSAYRRYFISTAVDQLFAGGQDEINNGGTGYKEARLNYFGRANYTFRDKYLAEFVWRYQGSYIFEKSGRYGFFPGVSLGYVLSEESFWDALPFMNFAKIRASWGQTGNDLIDPFQYLSSYSFGTLSFVTNGGSQFNKPLYEGVVSNTGVTWETATQKDIGIDMEFFDGALAVTADYFHNKRTNILAVRNASVPNSAGLKLPDENIGEFENKGFDFNIEYNGRASDVTYSIGLNGVYTKNKVLFWDEPPGAPDYQRSTGSPLASNLYYQAIGIFQNQQEIDAYPHWAGARPGDIIFKDYNEDGVIDGDDRVRHDKTQNPKFTGGLNIKLGYKGFDFSVLFQGAVGGVFYQRTEAGDFGNFLKSYYDSRWTEANPSTSNPRTYNRTGEYWVNQPNTYWLHKTDYVRLKNIELGYTLPYTLTGKYGIENLRLYVNAFNILTYSPDMKDFDPEVLQSANFAGYSYPVNKALNFGVSLTF